MASFERPIYVGVDIGKAFLDVATGRRVFRVPNDPAGHKVLLRKIRERKRPRHFVFEAGEYGRDLRQFLYSKKCLLSVLSAYRVRQFARAAGFLAKTDAVDARVLVEFGNKFNPPPTPRPDREIEDLREITRRRSQLIEAAHIQKVQLLHLRDLRLRDEAGLILETLSVLCSNLEKRAVLLAKSSDKLGRKLKLLTSVTGVGNMTAVQLIAELPELGRLNRREVASLAGLAPVNRDSGTTQGVRSIHGGRVHARNALYMAAFSASRTNHVLAPFYERLRKRGKFQAVALVAVMRKLLTYLNAIVRKNGNPKVAAEAS